MITLNRKEDCCGCGACVSACHYVAISFTVDAEGFSYPVVNEQKCVNCGVCKQVCPLIHRPKNDSFNVASRFYAVWLKDKQALKNSSSGGAFWALAQWVIGLGGVVAGAAYSDEMQVNHEMAFSLCEAQRFRGSKYVQSNTEGIYYKIEKELKTGRVVLFTGTPCQVEALKLFLRKPYVNLITVDLICHGVASPKLFADYVSKVNRLYHNRLSSINMRDKSLIGWGHTYSYRFHFKTGKSVVDAVRVSNWGRFYFSELINRPACHECAFANLKRSGDITLADYWDDRNLRPDLYSKEGVSLFMVNTSKGLDAFEAIQHSIFFSEITGGEAMQSQLKHSTRANSERTDFWILYQEKGFEAVYSHYFKDPFYRRLGRKLKRLYTGYRHIN